MKYSYWLSNIRGISHGKIFHLLETFSCAEEIYMEKTSAIEKLNILTEKDIKCLEESRLCWNLDEQFISLAEKGISFISFEQEDYPGKLRQIANPPYSLYYKGRLPDEEKRAVAIVGARGRSSYGMTVANELAKQLAIQNVSVISGMAKGIDGDAHKGALDGGGATYAVLGCGVDVCYPREHRYLYDRIPDIGGVISEYPVGTEPVARLFPARNRIISALSDCVVIIEAREKSGSLITADFAMEQGKDVYALPGRVTDSLSRGCNHLIQQGAGIFLGIDDFMKEISLASNGNDIQIDFRKNLLEKDESLVYSLLDFCPVSIGTLLDKTQYQLLELLEILKRLEDKGFIREISPNYYVYSF